MNERMKFLTDYPIVFGVIVLLIFTLVTYIILPLIGYSRNNIFKKLKLNKNGSN